VQGLVATGPRRGYHVLRLGTGGDVAGAAITGRRCADVAGFNVHANVRVRANDRDGLERLVKYLAEMGRLDEARTCFEKGMQLDPGDPMHVANLALTLAKQGKLREALPIAERAVRLGPGHPLANMILRAIHNDLRRVN